MPTSAADVYEIERRAEAAQQAAEDAQQAAEEGRAFAEHNAIKYSPNGGAVTDQGIGIPANKVRLLFRPFSRLPNGAKLEGTGLGLFISRGIVGAHGGQMSVVSDGPGTGSTFTIRLPLSGPPTSIEADGTAP